MNLYGLGNLGNFNYYIFDKKQLVAKGLSEIFRRVFNITWDFVDFDGKKEKKINIEKYKDRHCTISSKNVRVDVFYGSKRMFITIFCSLKLRAKFNDELEAICIMPKPRVSGSFFKEKKKKNAKKRHIRKTRKRKSRS